MEPAADDPTTVSERLLDVFVFAPAGLMVTAVEEFPRLVERGRERLIGQVTSARAVGAFAVTTGKSQLHKRAEELRRSRASLQRRHPARGRQLPFGLAPSRAGGPGRSDPDPVGQPGKTTAEDDPVLDACRRWPYLASTPCRPPRSSSGSMGSPPRNW